MRVLTHAHGEVLIAVVSDGAGSAPRAEEGAATVMASFLAHFEMLVQDDPSGLSRITREAFLGWLSDWRASLETSETTALGDYACTLYAAIVDEASAVSLQVGDGAIVHGYSAQGDYQIAVWPQHGEYANSTFFITGDDAATALEIVSHQGRVGSLALFTDGLEHLLLDFAARQAHAPAFRPIFQWLVSSEDPPERWSEAIAAFLASQRVCERTDDDRTLIVATRSSPIPSTATPATNLGESVSQPRTEASDRLAAPAEVADAVAVR